MTTTRFPRLNIRKMLTGDSHRISHVHRFSSLPVNRRENVAEHSWYVAFYSYLIGQDLQAQGVEIDFGELLSRALLHDIDESLTGDFLRYVKHDNSTLKQALDDISLTMVGKMSKEVGVNLRPQWMDAKADDTEGNIIKVVDLARVLSYVWEEHQTGNRHIDHIPAECVTHIVKFIEDFPDSPVTTYAQDIVIWAVHDLGVPSPGDHVLFGGGNAKDA